MTQAFREPDTVPELVGTGRGGAVSGDRHPARAATASTVTRTMTLPADLDPVTLLGAHDEVLRAVEKGFPEVDVHVRGTTVTVTAAQENQDRLDTALVLVAELIDVARTGTPLTPDAVERAVGLLDAATRPTEVLTDSVLSARGRTITPRSLGQKAYTDAIEESTITFGIGPAGTGKTYLAMAKAVDALARRQVSRIVLTRPAVEAGESLGFLPGSLTDKIDPYLRPLYDALHDMLEPEALPRLMAAGTIEVAPLAYMRGRTLNDAFVILDEAQNTTPEQMKMFLTRLGFGSTMVVTGDVSQVDLPGGRPSGLVVVRSILEGVEGISFCDLGSADVVRHRLVGRIIDAYASYEAQAAALQAGADPTGHGPVPRRSPRRRAAPGGTRSRGRPVGAGRVGRGGRAGEGRQT
ncbi:PhoH family protein [Actinomyces wuliandei]|uniref:PhoH family protein n=1 Tax=Actinomyces wuliandei TaxID=2057743 RepID=UPI000FD988E8|nr:PhoH family protein [Actinomyces wuliandei]